jgi:hypothetical protein
VDPIPFAGAGIKTMKIASGIGDVEETLGDRWRSQGALD